MSGINPYAYMQQVSTQLKDIDNVTRLETVLDELEYLYEVIPPDQQDIADELVSQVRQKLTVLKQQTDTGID
jgi:hypothetical protein